MGTFACLELARRKVSVIGLDQFTPPHDRGSHSGATRVFRIAYAEHPDYVPLAQRASLLWEELGQEAGATFLHRSGMLSFGPAGTVLIDGIRTSAAMHGLHIEELSADDIRSRFPALEPPSGCVGIFEPTAGWVDVDAALRSGLEQAKRAGAELRLNARVESWEQKDGEFRIATATDTFTAKRLIVTAGAWAGRLLTDLNLPITVLRRVLVWIDPLRPELFGPGVFPVFAFAENFFYGFPNIDNQGVKLAIHWSVGPPAGEIDVRQPEVTPDEIRPVLEAAARLMPSLAGPLPDARGRVLQAKTCLYGMTPDEHFIIDRHPQYEHAYFAAGFSGHGFKFAPAIGEALADLALNGRTSLPIGFLRLNR
jgi:sarcosine oxidase